MRRLALPLAVACLPCTLPLGSLVSQEPPPPPPQSEALYVFLDCQTFYCDFDHFRREIPYVNWMRDRQDAQVHILGTSQETGGGGREHTLTFIGLGEFQGRVDTLVYVSSNTDTETERRDALVQTVKLGLVPFIAATPMAQGLRITYEAPGAGPPTVTAAEDPWNLWVFETRVNLSLDGESEYRSWYGYGQISANRTAEDLKLNFRVYGRYSRQETDVPEQDTTYVAEQQRYTFTGLAAWSLSAHWSAGARASVEKYTYQNQDLALLAGPAVEYDIFPYAESTRRQVTLEYRLGVAAYNYTEVTVYDQTSEIRPIHTAEIGAEIQQPWGNIDVSLYALQYLHDLSQHHIQLYGDLSLRIFRGLNFDMYGSVARVKDQLYLSGAGLTPEERLLRVRAFATDYYYYAGIGLRYRFGSKFANVVNPRMGGGGF
jgi:hypothetical protein